MQARERFLWVCGDWSDEMRGDGRGQCDASKAEDHGVLEVFYEG